MVVCHGLSITLTQNAMKRRARRVKPLSNESANTAQCAARSLSTLITYNNGVLIVTLPKELIDMGNQSISIY